MPLEFLDLLLGTGLLSREEPADHFDGGVDDSHHDHQKADQEVSVLPVVSQGIDGNEADSDQDEDGPLAEEDRVTFRDYASTIFGPGSPRGGRLPPLAQVEIAHPDSAPLVEERE